MKDLTNVRSPPVADIRAGVYYWLVGKQNRGWLRTRDAESTCGPNSHVVGFRSDNDLHQWRLIVWFAIPLTALTYGLLESLGVPFRYSPAATIPAVCFALFIQYRARRDRKLGKRFSQYDADDLS